MVTNFQYLQENVRNSNLIDFSNDDHIASSLMNKIKKCQTKDIFTSKNFAAYTSNSAHDVNTVQIDKEINFPNVSLLEVLFVRASLKLFSFC